MVLSICGAMPVKYNNKGVIKLPAGEECCCCKDEQKEKKELIQHDITLIIATALMILFATGLAGPSRIITREPVIVPGA